MALGEAYTLHRNTGSQVAILDKRGRARSHPLWHGHKWLEAKTGPGIREIVNASGRRPYIAEITADKFVFQAYEPHPAPFRFTRAESDFANIMPAQRYIVIDPHTKPNAPPSKQWAREAWEALAKAAMVEGYKLAQPVWPGVQILPNVLRVPVNSHRETAALISGAAGVICHEGFNHHAAAAFDVPAVTIYGSFVSPRVTGYTTTRPLYMQHGGDFGCGARGVCIGCRKAMDEITPAMVLGTLQRTVST